MATTINTFQDKDSISIKDCDSKADLQIYWYTKDQSNIS